ncbi:MAG TPA: MMPL family transporter [Chloroflexia bacterium]|nr:MMPL family transporter [Chloroflexia bacterium]
MAKPLKSWKNWFGNISISVKSFFPKQDSRQNLTLQLAEWCTGHPWLVLLLWLLLTTGLFIGAILAKETFLPFQTNNSPGLSSRELAEGVVGTLSTAANFLIVIILLLTILLTSFGTVVAALLGLLMAVSSLLFTFGLLTLTLPPLGVKDVPGAIIIGLVGLGSSIDYTLFIVSRFRFKLHDCHDTAQALELASATAGKANFASAIIWTVTLSGLLLVRDTVLSTVALGTLFLIGISALGSVTVLPALLGLLGENINRGRLPYFGNDESEGSGLWGKVVITAARLPRLFFLLASAVLVVLLFPVLQLHLSEKGNILINPPGPNSNYLAILLLIFAYVSILSLFVILFQVRSILLAISSIIMSSLSSGAGLGIVVLVFQFGWFKQLLGLDAAPATIDRGLLVLFFPLFFGFSMSYQVLTLQRMAESRKRGSSTRVAVTNGVRVISGVVVSAGSVMRTAVTLLVAIQFSAFQQLGLGLLAGIYLDAVLVRCILIPAMLQLISRTRWDLPVVRDAIPGLDAEQVEVNG